MAAAGWAVKTSKRKSSSASPRWKQTPTPVKGTARSLRARKQQTLTQIQWVSSVPPVLENGEMDFLEPIVEPRASGRRQQMKKDSTLTQMEFFDLDLSNMNIEEVDAKPHFPGRAVPQVDGTYDSPRKPRPRKHYGKKRKSISVAAEESEESGPSEKKRKLDRAAVFPAKAGEQTRSSHRASKVLSDPAENFKVFEDALVGAANDDASGDTVLGKARQHLERKVWPGVKDLEELDNTTNVAQGSPFADNAQPPGVDIMGSASLGNAKRYARGPDMNLASEEPLTPRKERNTIQSSQSPESLPTSASKDSPDSQLGRRARPPLADLSANTPRRHKAVSRPDVDKSMSISKRKVCVLKLPRKHQGCDKNRVEDSQVDIWSIEPTSSPKPGKRSSMPCPILSQKPIDGGETQLEILETSQVVNGEAEIHSSLPRSETQDTLPTLSAIFGHPETGQMQATLGESQQASEELNIDVRDFATEAEHSEHAARYIDVLQSPEAERTWHTSTLTEMPFKEQTTNDECGSDFGTPIRNDTQFNAELEARLPTSPLIPAGSGSPTRYTSPHDQVRLSSSCSSGDAKGPNPLLLAPALVERDEHRDISSAMPLSGTISPLIPRTQPPTQWSVHPASMLHPSQVSTQEPSQRFPPMSSMGTLRSQGRSDTRLEPITIKDSSSIHFPLSELPEYGGMGSQANFDVRLSQYNGGEDEDEMNGELDLPSEIPEKEFNHVLSHPFTDTNPGLLRTSNNKDDEPADAHINSVVRQPSATEFDNRRQTQFLSQRASNREAKDVQRQADDQSEVVDTPRHQPAKFTQNGHVTAARIEQMRKEGLIPQGYNPPAFQIPMNPRDLLPAWMFEDDDDEDL